MIQHCQFFNEAIDFQTNLQPTINYYMKVLVNTPYRSKHQNILSALKLLQPN